MKKNLYILLFIILFIFIVPLNVIAKPKTVQKPYTIYNPSKGVYVIQINTINLKKEIMPFSVFELETNADVYEKTKALLVVNAGFFDPKSAQTVSYMVKDGEIVLNPILNSNLMSNKFLSEYIPKILNRSEFRVYECMNRIYYDIVPHNAGIPVNCKLKHSIQAGPMLTPDLRLEEEFFVLKRDGKIVSESASALHKYARTAIGIRNNMVYLFIATVDSPMTLMELSELTKSWNMEKAMAFDGGGSTSIDMEELHIVSEKDNQARKLKSFLIIPEQN